MTAQRARYQTIDARIVAQRSTKSDHRQFLHFDGRARQSPARRVTAAKPRYFNSEGREWAEADRIAWVGRGHWPPLPANAMFMDAFAGE